MANETIELLKNYTPAKMPWPAGVQEKLDGVPVIFIRESPITPERIHPQGVQAYTRQGEVVTSLKHISPLASYLITEVGGFLVGEVYCRGMPFKEISGLVRKKEYIPSKHKALSLNVFDANIRNLPLADWEARRRQFEMSQAAVAEALRSVPMDLPVRPIPTVWAHDAEEAEALWLAMQTTNPDIEGVVLHSTRKLWSPGKRCWGTQRIKDKPTIDLKIVSFVEAVEGDTLAGKGMVGRLVAEFTSTASGHPITSTIGIGPGKLTHDERKALWFQFKTNRWQPRIAEVQYMTDPTYDALRQPTFQRWRDDKDPKVKEIS